jgi:hypothetical protein
LRDLEAQRGAMARRVRIRRFASIAASLRFEQRDHCLVMALFDVGALEELRGVGCAGTRSNTRS